MLNFEGYLMSAGEGIISENVIYCDRVPSSIYVFMNASKKHKDIIVFWYLVHINFELVFCKAALLWEKKKKQQMQKKYTSEWIA